MENKVENLIVEWLKSDDENATNLAHKICVLFSVVGQSEQLCDLDGKTVLVKFKVTKHIPKIVIEDI